MQKKISCNVKFISELINLIGSNENQYQIWFESWLKPILIIRSD